MLMYGVGLGFLVLTALIVLVLFRLAALARPKSDAIELRTRLEALATQNERLERELRAELAQARSESSQSAQTARDELAGNLSRFTQTLQNQVASTANMQNE